MMRRMAKVVLALALVALVLSDSTIAIKHRLTEENEESLNKFEVGREYRFRYDAQTSTGYASSSVSQQRAVNRLQAYVQIVFQSSTEAVLRMRQIRTAQLSDVPSVHAWNPDRLQPISAFESRLFSIEQGEENDEIREFNRQLSLPVKFQYTEEGMIGAIRFQKSEAVATKNIKKAVLNLIQFNLRSANNLNNDEFDDELQIKNSNVKKMQGEEWNENYFGNSYTNFENTIEGQCETTYVISPNTLLTNGQQQRKLNVTKSINFDRCNALADVTYGFQGEPVVQDQQYWQQRDIMLTKKSSINDEYRKLYGQMIPKEKLERSTVLRYVVAMPETEEDRLVVGGANKFGIERVELLSEYTTESVHPNEAMQTIAVAELVYLNSVDVERSELFVEKKGKKMINYEEDEESREETLLYNADFESLEKSFMMFGDEKYQETAKLPISPIFIGEKSDNSIEQGKKMLRSAERELDAAVRSFVVNKDDGAQGINAPETAESLWNLVYIMRMCTVNGLKQLYERSTAASKDEKSTIVARELFANALALAGTRNTIALLVDMIEQRTIDQYKASQVLKTLGSGAGLPAPSESQVDLVLRLCKSKAIETDSVKRACWLTFGTMVGELSQQSQNAKNLGETEAPTKPFEFVTAHKKDLYKQVLIDGLKNAVELEVPYEKIVALKAIGNAGLLSTVEYVMKIVQDAQQPHDIRLHALDALRRVFQRQASTLDELKSLEKVQYGLLPVFENVRERPDVRMAIAAVLISNAASTNLPSKQALIDQIVYAMQNDRNEDVIEFVTQIFENLEKSPLLQQRKIGQHLKNALKVVKLPIHRTFKGSQYLRVESPCCIENNVHSFLNFLNIYNSKLVHTKNSNERVPQMKNIPSQMTIELDTLVNGNYQRNSLQMSMIQNNFDILFNELLSQFNYDKFDHEEENSSEERTNHADKKKTGGFFSSAAEQLTTLFRKLNIKDRQTFNSIKPKNAYAFITLRNNNVDIMVIPITVEDIIAVIKGESSTGNIQKIKSTFTNAFRRFSGASTELSGWLQWRATIALNQKAARLPTSVGMPLKVCYGTFLFGSLGMKHEQGKEGSEIVAIQPNVNFVEHTYMRVWMVPSAGVSAGMSWFRASELNLPLEAEFKTEQNQKQTIVSFRLPQEKIRVFGIHTFPSVFISKKSIKQSESVQFTKSFDSMDAVTGTFIVSMPIHNEQYSSEQREIDTIVGKNEKISLPFRIYGIYHLPRELSLYEWNRITKCSENSIHIDFVPINGETPREIKLTMEANLYESTIKHEQSQKEGHSWSSIRNRLEEFYSNFEHKFFGENNSNKFLNSEEEKEFEGVNNRNGATQETNYKEALELTHRYMKKSLEKSPSYKHSLKITAETVGVRRQLKATAEINAICDSKFRVCETRLLASRSPVLVNERQQWTMEMNMQSVYPEKLSTAQELEVINKAEKRHLKLFGAIQAKWGVPAEKKSIKMNILAEPSEYMIAKSIRIENKRQEHLRDAERRGLSQNNIEKIEKQYTWVPFLDQFHIAAEYQLGINEQNFVQRIFELIKTKYFWNTKSELINTVSSTKLPMFKASLRVDSTTLRQANLSIETPTQRVFISSFELPLNYYRLQLVVPKHNTIHRNKLGNEMSQFLNRVAPLKHNALFGEELFTECIIGQKDDAGQQNTIYTFDGITYSAPISKCYSVLAKDCTNAKGQPAYSVLAKQYGAGNQKTLKVISKYGVFEIQPTNEDGKTLQVVYNGKTYTFSTATVKEIEELDRHGIVFNANNEKNWVTIIVPSVLAIEFDGQYTHIQLSTDYKNTQCGLCGHYNDDSTDVFRMNNNKLTEDVKEFHRSFTLKDNNDCSNDHYNEFYTQGKFTLNDEEDEDKKITRFSKISKKLQNANNEEAMPVEQTVIYEYNQKVCFSLKPVAQCPKGWYSVDASGEDDLLKRTKVQFTCLERSSIETKQFKKIVHRVGIVDMSDYAPSYSELMVLPERCVQY